MKAKKLLSAFIAGAMVLTTMVVPAFADEPTATGTLPEAIDGTITLAGDVVLAETLSITEDTVIDLANHKITSADVTGEDNGLGVLISADGVTLTIQNGTVEAGSRTDTVNYMGSFYTIEAKNGATLNIVDATIKGSKAINTKSGGTAISANNSTVNIENGKIYGGDCEKKGVTESTYTSLNYNYSGEAGDAISAYDAEVTVTDSEIYGGNGTATDNTETSYISGGANFAEGGVAVSASRSNTVVTISNSTVKGGDSDLYNAENAIYVGFSAKLVVEAGTKIIGGSCHGTGSYGIAGTGIEVNMGTSEVSVTDSSVTGGSSNASWVGSGIEVPRNAENTELKIEGSTVAAGEGANADYTYAIAAGSDKSVSSLEIKNSTLVANTNNATAINSEVGDIVAEGTITVTGGTIPEEVKVYSKDGNAVTVTQNGTSTEITEKLVAKVGDKKYSSLADAINEATEGSTITLLSDTTLDTVEITKPLTIDLNKNTLSVGERKDITKDWITVKNSAEVTIENGKLDISGITVSANAIIEVGAYGGKSKLNLNKVNLVGDNYSSAFGVIYADPGDVTVSDCTIDLKNDSAYGGALFAGEEGQSNYVVNGTTIKLDNTQRAIKGTDVDITDTTMEIKNLEKSAFRNASGTIGSNSKITVDNADIGIENDNGSSLTLSDNAAVTITNSKDKDILLTPKNDVESTIKVTDKATLTAVNVDESTVTNITVGADANFNQTDTITVKFVKQENKDIYDIVLAAEDGKVIDRFTAADLKFDIEVPDGKIVPVFKAAKGITMTSNGNLDKAKGLYDYYSFHLNQTSADVDNQGITAPEITLGTVEFKTYGTFTFKVETENAEVQTARAANGSNIKKYTTDGEDGYKLIINNEPTGTETDGDAILDNITQAEATAEMTINIQCDNAVYNTKAAAYQEMTVTIKRDSMPEVVKTIELGADKTDDFDYTIDDKEEKSIYTIKAELPVNDNYTITLTGAGYRPVEYTKKQFVEKTTLTFWNDDKTRNGGGMAVEEGGEKVATTFLAGDIVYDNVIDKYDLSAVVSYFNPVVTDLDESNPKYNKYDLNRDGVIDITDVSFVLRSWGK